MSNKKCVGSVGVEDGLQPMLGNQRGQGLEARSWRSKPRIALLDLWRKGTEMGMLRKEQAPVRLLVMGQEAL